MEMGAHGGSQQELVMLHGNPLKYNEYRAAVDADKRVLRAGTPSSMLDGKRGPHWLNFGFEWALVPQRERDAFLTKAKEISSRLEQEAKAKGARAWVLKDPRMSLLAEHWIEAVGRERAPVCIIVTRDPLVTSRRLAVKYNEDGTGSLTVGEWARFWEEAMVHAAAACDGLDVVFAPHKVLAASPVALADSLAVRLGLTPLDPARISRLLGPDFAEKANAASEEDAWPHPRNDDEVLSPRTVALWSALSAQDLKSLPRTVLAPERPSWELPPGLDSPTVKSSPFLKSRHIVHTKAPGVEVNPEAEERARAAVSAATKRKQRRFQKEVEAAAEAAMQPPPPPKHTNPPISLTPRTKEAYATIVTGNDRGFVAGALVLAHSIRRFDRSRELIAMTSVEVDDPAVHKSLELAGWRVVPVPKLDEPWYNNFEECKGFTASQVVRWGRMFSKLNIFVLPYERVFYLDTDTMVLRDPSPYFALPGEFYAERSPSHKGFNAGIMLVRPDKTGAKLDKLIKYAHDNPPLVFWPNNQVGCTEQELLNRFYVGTNMGVKLNDTRHFDYLGERFTDLPGREEIKLHGARVAHCLTTKCEKPWDVVPRTLVRGDSLYDPRAIQPNCDPLMYGEWFAMFEAEDLREARTELVSAPPLPTAEGLRNSALDEGVGARVLKALKEDAARRHQRRVQGESEVEAATGVKVESVKWV